MNRGEKEVDKVNGGNEESRILTLGRAIDETGGFKLEIEPDRSAADLRNNKPGQNLRKKILNLPESPGVYMYLDKKGQVIYVGKAKRLKRRVSSYFNRIHDSVRTNLMVRNIVDMRFIVVHTEEEALHLENAMIKEYQPRYNVLLKDDKSYPWIVVTKELYPRVFLTREKGLKAQYYGPYSNTSIARLLLDLIREIYPLRSCRHVLDEKSIVRGKYSLCLDYHIKKCSGACRGLINPEQYGEVVKKVKQILRGETVVLENHLRSEMECLSERMEFEAAEAVKQQYLAVKKYNSKSLITRDDGKDIDMFAYVERDDSAVICYMHLHRGAIVQSVNIEYRKRMDESKENLLSMAIGEVKKMFGREFQDVIVPFLPEVEFKDINFDVPSRGEKRKVLMVGEKNAAQYLSDKQKQREALDPEKSVRKLMERMKQDFRLSEEPRHIECFDNSNIQGTNPVASCVVFRNGKPAKRDYRTFKIQTVQGANDFASMKEVLHRRYSRMISEGSSLPQLVVVDGGKGQLSAAVEAFDELGIRGEVALVGIAKRLEEIYFPGDSLPLYIDKLSPSLRVIQHLRDEAHRFGITFHRKLRSQGQVHSQLDEIKGIGEKTGKKLMLKFKSIKRLKEASVEDIALVIGGAKAKTVYNFFHSGDKK